MSFMTQSYFCISCRKMMLIKQGCDNHQESDLMEDTPDFMQFYSQYIATQ